MDARVVLGQAAIGREIGASPRGLPSRLGWCSRAIDSMTATRHSPRGSSLWTPRPPEPVPLACCPRRSDLTWPAPAAPSLSLSGTPVPRHLAGVIVSSGLIAPPPSPQRSLATDLTGPAP